MIFYTCGARLQSAGQILCSFAENILNIESVALAPRKINTRVILLPLKKNERNQL